MAMTFATLSNFIQKRMRMSHIYQPVMLMTLLQKRGRGTSSEIAKAILAHDQSQIEYYEDITRDMPGRVLRTHRVVRREGKTYFLIGYDQLSLDQIKSLISLCHEKLNEYMEKRGRAIFQHRRLSIRDLSDTMKYEVLKRAKLRCELCGISNEFRPLEVDHILPRSHGGTDTLENLQSLCYSCNAMKGNRDDTKFGAIRRSYDDREQDCLFCQVKEKDIIVENELAFGIMDGFPVTPSHMLIMPKRHIADYFSLYRPENNACTALLTEARNRIKTEDHTVKGFNVGINNGETAGQTIFHCHIHLIPRRTGDVENPRGGIRNVIPGKGAY